ncbi:MAG: nucleotidyltransferase domain-containing protein [Nanoarchaeota archaeon]
MLSQTELKILEQLFKDLTREYTIREVSLSLNLPYPQIHRTITSLLGKKLVKKREKGKSIIINLVLEEFNGEYVTVEMERRKKILERYKVLKILMYDLEKIEYNQFVCLLFGSYAEKKAKKGSDIDLLFVIPTEYNYEKFERFVKSAITLSRADINITTEAGLLEMWKNPLKLNVGNELLKKHVVLFGAEQFLRLRRKHYVG